MTMQRTALLLAALAVAGTHAFVTITPSASSVVTVMQADGTGGWGIGNSRDMVPEEFAKRGGERNAFEGYKLRERGDFMRQVQQDQKDLMSDEMEELLGVASIAGIKVKDPTERLDKFMDEEEDEDDLDVSVQWDKPDPVASRRRRRVDDSITRMDEDTGAPGSW
jgi:hypothetical protein